MMDANLNLYKYFIAVMDERSITRAAHKLGVSQPTVTYNIKELEKHLQHKLFVVGKHGVCPEPRAITLYHRIKPAYQSLLAIIDEFTG